MTERPELNRCGMKADFFLSGGDGIPDRIEGWYANIGYHMGCGTTDDA